MFRVDWLHTVDVGVAADIAGNLLLMTISKMQGGNKDYIDIGFLHKKGKRCDVLSMGVSVLY